MNKGFIVKPVNQTRRNAGCLRMLALMFFVTQIKSISIKLPLPCTFVGSAGIPAIAFANCNDRLIAFELTNGNQIEIKTPADEGRAKSTYLGNTIVRKIGRDLQLSYLKMADLKYKLTGDTETKYRYEAYHRPILLTSANIGNNSFLFDFYLEQVQGLEGGDQADELYVSVFLLDQLSWLPSSSFFAADLLLLSKSELPIEMAAVLAGQEAKVSFLSYDLPASSASVAVYNAESSSYYILSLDDNFRIDAKAGQLSKEHILLQTTNNNLLLEKLPNGRIQLSSAGGDWKETLPESLTSRSNIKTISIHNTDFILFLSEAKLTAVTVAEKKVLIKELKPPLANIASVLDFFLEPIHETLRIHLIADMKGVVYTYYEDWCTPYSIETTSGPKCQSCFRKGFNPILFDHNVLRICLLCNESSESKSEATFGSSLSFKAVCSSTRKEHNCTKHTKFECFSFLDCTVNQNTCEKLVASGIKQKDQMVPKWIQSSKSFLSPTGRLAWEINVARYLTSNEATSHNWIIKESSRSKSIKLDAEDGIYQR